MTTFLSVCFPYILQPRDPCSFFACLPEAMAMHNSGGTVHMCNELRHSAICQAAG